MDEDEKGVEQLVQKAYDKFDDLYQEKKEDLMKTMDEAHAEKEAYDVLYKKYKNNLIKEYNFLVSDKYDEKQSYISSDYRCH